MSRLTPLAALVLLTGFAPIAIAQAPAGEAPVLGSNRITQADILSGALSENDIRLAGQFIFSAPFNKHDGYGDGPMNPLDTTSPGGRPTLQNNGTFLRVNGLDAQTCMECHSVGSNAVVPFRFAVGGVGSSNSNAMFQPRNIDVDDSAGSGLASFDGRYINPPFLFGSGGIELLGKEMTSDLQRMKTHALVNPDQVFPLSAHGVDFGSLSYNSSLNDWDLTGVKGVDGDLVVRPFGRKGEFATVRGFDVGAMQFHFGMQPVEVVGAGVDGDGDGVTDEILIGELSALHLFNVSLKRPAVDAPTVESFAGAATFQSIGCVDCHTPVMTTRSRHLTLSFPEVDASPALNVFRRLNLETSNAGFQPVPGAGVAVPLFSDLKRHNMGAGLAESFGHGLDSEFITARLWGVADTAPYLHDGRATTLTEAILLHGGEAQVQRDAFDQLADSQKVELLAFLRSLRTPLDPTGGL